MTTIKFLSAIFALAVLSACASQMPAPTPQDGASAGIGASVKTRAPIKIFSTKVDSVMFVRLESDDTSQYMSNQPIASNYNKDGYIYLLNAPPARYRLDWHGVEHETQRMTLADVIVIPDHTLVEVEL